MKNVLFRRNKITASLLVLVIILTQVIAFNFTSIAAPVTYQAESAARSGGAIIETSHTGYTGTGFVGGYTDTNKGYAATTFTVSASSTGNYSVELRYANGTGSAKTLSIYVNSVKIKQTNLPATANWDSWGTAIETLALNVGNNTVQYKFDTTDSGNVNLDRINVDAAGGPDLIVTDIAWTPANPVAGNEVTFRAVVKNQGTSASPAGVKHGLNILVDGVQVNWCDTYTSSIPAGGTATLTANWGPAGKATWTAASGSHTVQVVIDDVALIAESNESNNSYSESVSVGGGTGSPDLIVTDITWTPASPLTDNEISFSAVIKNQGTAASPAGTIHGVLFSIDGASVSWSDNYTSSIAAGASVTVTATGGPGGKATWTGTTGSHTVQAFVDDINRITESNDSNNTYSETISVNLPSKPDLIVTDISWSPASPAAGNNVIFSAVVKNQGTAATAAGTACNVSFYVDGVKVTWVSNYTASIAVGASVTLTQNNGSWAAANGVHSISAAVDETSLISELNENNNSYSESMTVGTVQNYGATVPYDTYEAENMTIGGGTVTGPSTAWCTAESEASGRKAVRLAQGQSVELTLNNPAQGIVVRYSMPDSATGSDIYQNLSIYVNSVHNADISLTNRYTHQYGQYGSDGGEMQWSNTPGSNHHRYFDESRFLLGQQYAAGTRIKLQWDANDYNPNGSTYVLIDFIETETVPAALVKPSDYASITNYGATANDGADDTAAMTAAIAAVNGTSVKGVWIPEGTFDFKTGTRGTTRIRLPSGVSVKGAGMWRSTLQGPYAGIILQGGNVMLSDFTIKAEETYRSNATGIAGIEGNALNSTIRNLWMQHNKVGLWLNEGTANALISQCRIRDTWADGINLNGGAYNTTVEQCNFRNTGDDGMAMWSKSLNGGTGTVESCTFRYNTVQIPNLANGIGIYGGKNNTVSNNLVLDVVDNGSGIQFGTNHSPTAFTGSLTISNNRLVRCGSYHHDYGYQIGAVWGYWLNNNGLAQGLTVNVTTNLVENSTYAGVFIEEPSSSAVVNYTSNTINSSGTYGVYIRGSANGSAAFSNNTVNVAPSGKFRNDSSNFTVTGSGNNW